MTTEPLKTAAIGTARDYQNLPAWQNAMSLAESIYAQSEKFPEREHAGLAATLRGTATMIAGAIAAASGGADEGEIADFYREAQSLLAELATQAELATRLGYMKDTSEINESIDSITRLVIGMQHGLKIAARDAQRAERDAEREERQRAREERGDRGGDRPYKKPFKKFEDGDRPRREFKPREERGDREDRPRREFKDRGERGDRPFKKREDRDGGDRPRRDFKKRDDRDGDRPYKKREDSRGDRRGFGGGKKDYSKRDFGGKKPFRKKDRD